MKKLSNTLIFAFIFCSAALCAPAVEQKPVAISAGDTLCFAGDSITHHGYYPKHIALYYVTRFPNVPVKFRNAGVEGNSAIHVLSRIDSDLRPDKKTVFTLMLGMNDCRYGRLVGLRPEDKKARHAEFLEEFKNRIAELSEALAEDSKKLILLSSSIYDGESDIKKPITVGINGEIIPKKDDSKTPERNRILKDYADFIVNYAKSNSIACADIWKATDEANKAMHLSDKSMSAIGPDRVHPFNLGGLIIAEAFLSAMGESPIVSEVSIDALKPEATKSVNAKVSALAKNSAGSISFELLERSLPYPITGETAPAAKLLDFYSKLDKQILRVQNLPGKRYNLLIDGKSVGKYTAKDFSKGINLALNPETPQYKQALEVEKLLETWRANVQKYRNCLATEMAYKIDSSKPEEARLKLTKVLEDKNSHYYAIKRSKDYLIEGSMRDKFLSEADKALSEAYAAAQPRSHTYKLERSDN